MSAENDNSSSSFELQQGVSDNNSKVFIRQALEALINGSKEPGDPDEKEYKINVKLTFTPSPMKKVWVARSSQELNSSTVRNEPPTKERKQTFKGKLSWSSDDEENRRDESVKDLEESERVSEAVALTFSDSEENRHSLNSSFSKKSKKKPENEQTLEQTDDSTAQASELQKSSDAVECTLPTVETSPNSQNESIAEESILANKTGDTPTEEKSEIYEDLAAFSSELWDSHKWDSFCTTVDDLKKMHHKNGAQTSSRDPQKNKVCAKKKDTSSQKSTQVRLNEGNSDQNLQEIPEKEIGGNGVTPENLLLFCSRLQSSDLDDYFNTKLKKKRDKPKEETADVQLQVNSDRISDLGNSELESPPIQGFKKKKNKRERANNEDLEQHTNETELKVHNEESELDSSSSSVKDRKRKKDKKRDNKELNNDPSNETKPNGNIDELQTSMTIDHEATTDDEEFQSSQIFRSRKPAMGDKAKDSSTQEEFAKELLECMEISDDLGHENEAESNSRKSRKNKDRTGVDEDLENSEFEDRSTFSSPKKSKKRKKRGQEAPTSDDTAADDDSGCPPEDAGMQESDLPTERKKKPKSHSNGENSPVNSVVREEIISVDRGIPNEISTDEKIDIVQEEPGTSVKKKNKRKVHNSGDEMASASEADIPQGTDGESKIPQKSMLEEILGAINNVYAEDQSSKKFKKKKRLGGDKEEAVVKSDETAPDDGILQDSNLPNKKKKKHKSGGSSKEDLAVDSSGKVETSSETESGLSRESEILRKSESPTKKKKWLKSVQEVTESSSKIEEEEVYDTEKLDDYFAPVVEDEVLQGSMLSTKTKKKKRHLGDDGESTDNALKEESIELYFKDEDEAVLEKELAPKRKKKHKFLQDHQEELSVHCAQEEESNLNGDIILDGESELPTKKKKNKRKLHEDLDELAHDDAASEILPLESVLPEAKKKKKKKRRRSLEEEKPADLDLAHEEEIVEARDVEAVLEEPALPTKRKKHHKSTRCQNEIDLIGHTTHRDEAEESAVDADMDSVEIRHDPEGGSSIMVSPRKKSKKKQKHHENTEESEDKTRTEISVDNDSSENYSHKKRRESKEYHVLKNVQEPINELHRGEDDAQNEQYAFEDDACPIDTTLYIHEGSLEKDSVKSNISSDSPHSSKSKAAVKRRRTSSVSEDNNPPALKKSDSRVQPQSILADLMYTENPKVSNRNDSIKIKSEPRRVCLNEDSDVEDAVDRAKEAKALSASRNHKIKSFDVMIDWKINPLHMIETRICGAPDKQQWELINSLGVDIKNGVFTKEEDTQIMENWRRFCEVHDWGDDPEPFLNKKLLRNIPLKQRIDFARFIARGLDNRLLKSVFGRFQRLVDTKRVRGRFTAEEDRIIVEYIKKTDSNVPFADLAKLLNRNNTAVIKRCMVLSAKEDQQIKWTDENIKTFVRHLLKVTKKTEVEELRDFTLTERHWAKMSKRMDLPVTKLRRAWIYTIQPRIYADEDIGTDEVKKKLIDLLYKNHEYDWRNVNWDEYAKEFEVEKLNGARLSKFLKTMVSYYCPTNIHDDLRACVKCLKKVVVTNVVFYHKKIRKLELDLSS